MKDTDNKPFKNAKGEYLWAFGWTIGGGNDVWAKTRRAAISKIKIQFPNRPDRVSLIPQLDTLRKLTPAEARLRDKQFAMMCA